MDPGWSSHLEPFHFLSVGRSVGPSVWRIFSRLNLELLNALVGDDGWHVTPGWGKHFNGFNPLSSLFLLILVGSQLFSFVLASSLFFWIIVHQSHFFSLILACPYSFLHHSCSFLFDLACSCLLSLLSVLPGPSQFFLVLLGPSRSFSVRLDVARNYWTWLAIFTWIEELSLESGKTGQMRFFETNILLVN